MTRAIGQPPTFTVSEFVAVFNQSIDMMFPQITIVGELSNFRVSKGKWVYFDLKDEYSSVKFFGTVFALPGPLEDGITCEVVGRPRLHNQFGFSINYESIRAVGEGSIKKAQELLYKKLESEGLFANERKRSLPYPPQRIGLITSAESAAIADFRKIMSARWPTITIELVDTLVQGANAPAAIVAAVQRFNALSVPPEVLVVIRGGGSADDLAAFSDESVVRAIAASRIPTLVAIGHENDSSLAELVADRRASTPSNAAELLVPDVTHELASVRRIREQLSVRLRDTIIHEQRFIAEQHERVHTVLQRRLSAEYQSLQSARALLKAYDPRTPLRQGYAIVRAQDDTHVRSISNLPDVFSIELTDGIKQIHNKSSE